MVHTEWARRKPLRSGLLALLAISGDDDRRRHLTAMADAYISFPAVWSEPTTCLPTQVEKRQQASEFLLIGHNRTNTCRPTSEVSSAAGNT